MPSIHLERRNRLLEQMGQGVAILPTSVEAIRNRDSHYPFRFDSHFHYLSGFPEPEAALVLIGGQTPKQLLFCREKDFDREIWDGFRYGVAAAGEKFLFDEAHPISKLPEMLPKLFADQPKIAYPVGANAKFDSMILAALETVRSQARSGVAAPLEIIDVRGMLDEMRLVKCANEIGIMRRAARISADAHDLAMRQTRPGMMEYQIEALFLHEFRRHGAQSVAYSSIVAGGGNACVLHYVANDCQLKDGQLLLVDAGCELDGYASDITRTYPVSGKFNPVQKDLYQMVLAAQMAALAEIAPGKTWDDPHQAAVRTIAQGLIDLGLCQGSLDGVIESGGYKRFYMHRTGHWLGLDVHDVGNYKVDGQWRKLAPGMTLTVEPGCYIRPDDKVPQEFWNIGIRIEDEVLVASDGCEILSRAAPKTVNEIEERMRR